VATAVVAGASRGVAIALAELRYIVHTTGRTINDAEPHGVAAEAARAFAATDSGRTLSPDRSRSRTCKR
jgi:hypothetical protein